MNDSKVCMDETIGYGYDVSSTSVSDIGLTATASAQDNDLGDHLGSPYTFGCQTRQPNSDTFGVQANEITSSSRSIKLSNIEEKDCGQCVGAVEPYCHVKLNGWTKLKDSTRKLLSLLDEIEASTCTNQSISIVPQVSNAAYNSLVTDLCNKPNSQPRSLDTVDCESEVDDCSVYKRLTRKCNCLNQFEYNDFIIHFNESTKYFTSTIGEIIKNLRIVKKFLYIGGDYTKHALMFLNEGLTYSNHMEKLDIIQGCAHSDICNVFDDHTIVIVCIMWPCNDSSHGDSTMQALAATFLNKLAHIEEGRRYLKFSSKIANDLKKVVRLKSSKLEYDTLESINGTLNLMQPPLAQHATVSYYCKPAKEGFGSKTVNTLIQYRAYMTKDEVFTHLDLLNNLSNNETGKAELAAFRPILLKLFKFMLMEYDDSEVNIIITKIINNVVTRSMVQPQVYYKSVIMVETATEPIQKKNQMNQIPIKKPIKKPRNYLRVTSPSKYKQASKIKSMQPGWDPSVKKFTKGPNYSVIIVPVKK